MIRSLLHTPEGVRDIYNQECAKKMVLQENLQKLLKQRILQSDFGKRPYYLCG